MGIIPSDVAELVVESYNPRSLPAYDRGREACRGGMKRKEYPRPIECNASDSADRLAWMTGHLDEEFKRWA